MSSAIADREVPEGFVCVLERRRSHAAGLHGGRVRGSRSSVRQTAIMESILSYGDSDDDDDDT